MPGAPFCLSGFSKVQESHAYSVLCVHLYALFPHFPQHFQSIDQFITFEQQRLNFWTFFFFTLGRCWGEEALFMLLLSQETQCEHIQVRVSPGRKTVLQTYQARSQMTDAFVKAPGIPSHTIQSPHPHGFSGVGQGTKPSLSFTCT